MFRYILYNGRVIASLVLRELPCFTKYDTHDDLPSTILGPSGILATKSRGEKGKVETIQLVSLTAL